MKFDVAQMNRDRTTSARPATRTLAEFARETGQAVTTLGKEVKRMGLLPSIGKSYSLKDLQALNKPTRTAVKFLSEFL